MKNSTLHLTFEPPCGVTARIRKGAVLLSVDMNQIKPFCEWLTATLEHELLTQLAARIQKTGRLQ